ncbi:MAG: SOS response-associated peptidase [Candidatus Accumulibacter sp. UW26]|jgi:putative SOS response-associated peptidase YedK
MCGRYALYAPAARIREQFDVDDTFDGFDSFDFGPRYNIAPTTQVLVIGPGSAGRRVASLQRWGLIPAWAKDERMGAKLFNARAETVAAKPAFRTAFRRSRCIVPASGFYEWQSVEETGRTKKSHPIKQPYYIRPEDEGELFGFAGLGERWVSPDGEEIRSCCIITTDANALMAPIHERMPAILCASDYAAWLDPKQTDPDALRRLLGPAEAAGMLAYPVSRAVNSSRGDAPTFVQAAASSGGDPASPGGSS